MVLNDIERLKRITQRDRELNSWAIRSFRDVADGDYIAARMAYRAQLPVQFLCLLKSPFPLWQLMLRPTVDTLLGDVGAPVTSADPTNMGAFPRNAPTGNTGITPSTSGAGAQPAAAGAARHDGSLALDRARAPLDRMANGGGDR